MRLLPIFNIEIVLVFEALLSGIWNPKNLRSCLLANNKALHPPTLIPMINVTETAYLNTQYHSGIAILNHLNYFPALYSTSTINIINTKKQSYENNPNQPFQTIELYSAAVPPQNPVRRPTPPTIPFYPSSCVLQNGMLYPPYPHIHPRSCVSPSRISLVFRQLRSNPHTRV